MYRLDSDQQAILERLEAVADEHIGPHAARVDEEGLFPEEAVAALGSEGFLGLTVPEEFGGMGQNVRMACAALDQIAQRCASTAMVYLMHVCGLACYLQAPERTAGQLREAAEGRHLSTLAFSEKGSRSHFWAPLSQESREDGVARLSAEKSWVTSAGHAQGYVVSCRWARGEEFTQSMLYLVLDEDDGMSVSGPWKGLGMRGNASAPMTLEDVALSEERALTEEGKGFDAMLAVVLPVFSVGSAAVSAGLCEAAVAATRKHLTAQRFEHLDSKLADLPNLRERLARMRVETDRARAHLAAVIDSLEEPGPETQLLVLEVKAAASESALEVTDIGMRACGGAAFSKHLGLERIFRDARAAVVMAPTSDHAHDFIGRALCGMELF